MDRKLAKRPRLGCAYYSAPWVLIASIITNDNDMRAGLAFSHVMSFRSEGRPLVPLIHQMALNLSAGTHVAMTAFYDAATRSCQSAKGPHFSQPGVQCEQDERKLSSIFALAANDCGECGTSACNRDHAGLK